MGSFDLIIPLAVILSFSSCWCCEREAEVTNWPEEKNPNAWVLWPLRLCGFFFFLILKLRSFGSLPTLFIWAGLFFFFFFFEKQKLKNPKGLGFFVAAIFILCGPNYLI